MAAAYSRKISDSDWYRANQQFLTQALSQVEHALVERAGDHAGALNAQMRQALNDDLAGGVLGNSYNGKPFALEQLVKIYDLSEFEANVLLLCAGMELQSQWPQLCKALSGVAYPTIGLLQQLFEDTNWQGLDPDSALRRSHLIQLGQKLDQNSALVSRSIKIDERILHFLMGRQYLDARLRPLMRPVAVTSVLLPSHQLLVEHMVNIWRQVGIDTASTGINAVTQQNSAPSLAAIQLVGDDSANTRTVATTVCDRYNLMLYEISAGALPTNWRVLQKLVALCEREYRLGRLALLLNCEQLDDHTTDSRNRIAAFIDTVNIPLIIIGQGHHAQRQRPIISKQVLRPTPKEQQVLWYRGLQQAGLSKAAIQRKTDTIKALVTDFDLSASAIHSICLQVAAEGSLEAILRKLCQQQTASAN